MTTPGSGQGADRGGGSVADDVEDLELDLLLEGVHRRWGPDFREYSRASLRRRLRVMARDEGVGSLSALQERILRDPACMQRMIRALAVNVTSMFRDPGYFLALRNRVIPLLRTWPSVRIWIAGCSTGEEVYSFAILLRESGLLPRATIHATDMDAHSLRVAQEGVYPIAVMKEYTGNYLAAGGKTAFSDYYTARYDLAIFHDFLRDHVTFSQHDLASDGPFNEFQLVSCRNVMIYFNDRLRNRAHELIFASLSRMGVLGLGSKETVDFTPHSAAYEPLDEAQRLWRRVR